MPPKWLYAVDSRGVVVAADFAERLRGGDRAALRQLAKVKLTRLYRSNYVRHSPRSDSDGLFWSDVPPSVRIPLVHSGRRPPSAWVRDYVAFVADRDKKKDKKVLRLVKEMKRSLSSDQGLTMKFEKDKVTGVMLKPNPDVELVVVNRHDRAALLTLLGGADTDTNVAAWLAARTRSQGITQFKLLYDDYVTWCGRRGEAAIGSRAFALALVESGVVKLGRRGTGQHYALELRTAKKARG